jgi:hypothetical protein
MTLNPKVLRAHSNQGCQIFLRKTYQNGKKIPNNDEKLYQTAPNGRKMEQIAIK